MWGQLAENIYSRLMKFLNSAGKRSSFVILASGLCTFFMPIFSAATSGVERTGWSPWRIASHVNAQNVRPSDILFNMTLSGLAIVYALMVCGLVAIHLSRPRKALVSIAIIGSIVGYDPVYWGHHDFTGALFRSMGVTGTVRYEPGIYILSAIMPLLLYVSLKEN